MCRHREKADCGKHKERDESDWRRIPERMVREAFSDGLAREEGKKRMVVESMRKGPGQGSPCLVPGAQGAQDGERALEEMALSETIKHVSLPVQT